MAAYTVHIAKGADGESAQPEKIVFLHDGFSWPAFLFGPFWLAWNKAWSAALLWLSFLVLLGVGGSRWELSSWAISILSVAAGCVLALEGSRLVSWTLARRGYVETAVVVAADLEEAEEVFFHSWRPAAPVSSGEPAAGGSLEERRT